MSRAETLASARLHFNWGYHQGADDAQRGKPMLLRHFDKAYHAGHDAGHCDARNGTYQDNSTPAWQEYKS